MNENQARNLSQKQKELIKRLDNIRQNKNSRTKDLNKTEETTVSRNSQRRNENTERNQSPPKKARNTPDKRRSRTTKQETFARPVQNKQSVRNLKTKTKRKKTSKKKQGHFIDQLSDGENLSQAIILSEILSKPIALRKKNN